MTPKIAKNWIASSMLPYEEACKGFCGKLEVNGEPCNGPIAQDTFDPTYSIEEILLEFYPDVMEAYLLTYLDKLSIEYEQRELSDREFAGMAHALLVGFYRAKDSKNENITSKTKCKYKVLNWAHEVGEQIKHNLFTNKKGGNQ